MEGAGLKPPAGALGPREAASETAARIGGKAWGLARLSSAGLPVPEWCVVPADVAARWMAENAATLAERLATWIGGGGVALRSSSPLEDSRHESQAGQFKTLFVSDIAEVAAAFREVAGDPPIPVIIQRALQPEWAGVAFSANPAAAMPREILIEAVQGHGEQLVSGQVDPLRVSWPGLAQENVPLPHELQRQVGALVLASEDALDSAVDVEWCWAEEELWILQARPITAMRLADTLLPDEPISSWFFDQRFPDPVSPFTAGTLLPLIAEVSIGDAMRMRGMRVPRPLLQFYAGRPYIAVRHFDAILRGAPRWWLSPDLRQIFGPRGRASGGLYATLEYALSAARSVLANFHDVFLNIRAWHDFTTQLPENLARLIPLTPSHGGEREGVRGDRAWHDFEYEWNHYDNLTLRFLQIHRWSILWADYFYRSYKLLPGAWRTRWNGKLAIGIELPTAQANGALEQWREHGDDAARDRLVEEFGNRSASLDYAVQTWAEMVEGEVTGGRSPLTPALSPPKRGERGKARADSACGTPSFSLLKRAEMVEGEVTGGRSPSPLPSPLQSGGRGGKSRPACLGRCGSMRG